MTEGDEKEEKQGDFADALIRLLRSPIGKLAILIVLVMLLLVIYVGDPLLVVLGGFALFGVFEFFHRKRHLLEKRIVVPLPSFLEPSLGSVCSRCGKNVGRGNLLKAGNGWVCEECSRVGEKEEVKGEEGNRKSTDLNTTTPTTY